MQVVWILSLVVMGATACDSASSDFSPETKTSINILNEGSGSQDLISQKDSSDLSPNILGNAGTLVGNGILFVGLGMVDEAGDIVTADMLSRDDVMAPIVELSDMAKRLVLNGTLRLRGDFYAEDSNGELKLICEDAEYCEVPLMKGDDRAATLDHLQGPRFFVEISLLDLNGFVSDSLVSDSVDYSGGHCQPPLVGPSQDFGYEGVVDQIGNTPLEGAIDCAYGGGDFTY